MASSGIININILIFVEVFGYVLKLYNEPGSMHYLINEIINLRTFMIIAHIY